MMMRMGCWGLGFGWIDRPRPYFLKADSLDRTHSHRRPRFKRASKRGHPPSNQERAIVGIRGASDMEGGKEAAPETPE